MDSNDSKEKLKPLENETLESQFKRFATLRHLHPEKCKQLHDDGEKMIEYSFILSPFGVIAFRFSISAGIICKS